MGETVWRTPRPGRSRKSRRRKRRLSKLHPYREELETLRREGASYRELAGWLCVRKRRRVHPSTVGRYLASLPVEVQEEIPGLDDEVPGGRIQVEFHFIRS